MNTIINGVITAAEEAELKNLIEEDVCLSCFDTIKRITVVEKGKEFNSLYEDEENGISFFHTIADKTWHVRIQQ